MRCPQLLFTLCGVLALGGCAATSGSGTVPSGPPAGEAALAGLFGTWESTDSYAPPGADPIEVQAFEGLYVQIDADTVIGLRGNRCDAPTFVEVSRGPTAPAAVRAAAEGLGLAGQSVVEIAVLCAGQAFDTFYQVEGGPLLTTIGTAVYRLDPHGAEQPQGTAALLGAATPMATTVGAATARAGGSAVPAREPRPAAGRPAAPSGAAALEPAAGAPAPQVVMAAAPATQAAPPAAPVPRQRVADTRPAAPAQVAQSPPAVASWPRQAAHLASYRQAGDAETGWQVLSARHAALRDMTPVLVSVDIPGRGRFLRLFAVPGSDAALRPLCAEMQGVGNYCQPMTITAADGAVALFGGTVPQATALAPEAPGEPAPPAVAEAPPPAPEPAEPAVAQDHAQPAEPAAEPPAAAEEPAAEEPQVAAMVDTGPLPGGSHGAATTAVGAIPGDWRGGLEGTPDAETAPAQEPHPDHAAEEPAAVEPAAEEPAAEEPAAEQHAAAPPAPEPAPQADMPANPETASAATMLTPDFLYGRWGFSDPETGCNSADFIAFYPEGSANLYDELEGTWEIDGEMVHLHLTALDEVRSSGRRDIFLDMRVENITDDRFQATFVSAGESAAMAAFRCR